MIKIEDLKVKFKDNLALDIEGEIEIEEGSKVGIIGSNGAGKTTLIRSILDMVPHKGKIETSIPINRIAVHMQDNNYSDVVNVKTIMEAVLGKDLKYEPKAMELIDFFSFEKCLKRKFKHLSGGEKQKMTLILVMCQGSPITMYDEVTSGLDFETRENLMGKIVQWYNNSKDTVLITSHYYRELELFAEKILFLDHGKLIAYGDKKELFEKYCGKSVILCDHNEKTAVLKDKYRTIKSMEGSIAFACDSAELEVRIAEELSSRNVDYKRSSQDIELMTINAKEVYENENK